MLYIFGTRTFVPLSWKCKKQPAVSHSSSESEIILLQAGKDNGWMVQLALQFSECVLGTLTNLTAGGYLCGSVT